MKNYSHFFCSERSSINFWLIMIVLVLSFIWMGSESYSWPEEEWDTPQVTAPYPKISLRLQIRGAETEHSKKKIHMPEGSAMKLKYYIPARHWYVRTFCEEAEPFKFVVSEQGRIPSKVIQILKKYRKCNYRDNYRDNYNAAVLTLESLPDGFPRENLIPKQEFIDYNTRSITMDVELINTMIIQPEGQLDESQVEKMRAKIGEDLGLSAIGGMIWVWPRSPLDAPEAWRTAPVEFEGFPSFYYKPGCFRTADLPKAYTWYCMGKDTKEQIQLKGNQIPPTCWQCEHFKVWEKADAAKMMEVDFNELQRPEIKINGVHLEFMRDNYYIQLHESETEDCAIQCRSVYAPQKWFDVKKMGKMKYSIPIECVNVQEKPMEFRLKDLHSLSLKTKVIKGQMDYRLSDTFGKLLDSVNIYVNNFPATGMSIALGKKSDGYCENAHELMDLPLVESAQVSKVRFRIANDLEISDLCIRPKMQGMYFLDEESQKWEDYKEIESAGGELKLKEVEHFCVVFPGDKPSMFAMTAGDDDLTKFNLEEEQKNEFPFAMTLFDKGDVRMSVTAINRIYPIEFEGKNSISLTRDKLAKDENGRVVFKVNYPEIAFDEPQTFVVWLDGLSRFWDANITKAVSVQVDGEKLKNINTEKLNDKGLFVYHKPILGGFKHADKVHVSVHLEKFKPVEQDMEVEKTKNKSELTVKLRFLTKVSGLPKILLPDGEEVLPSLLKKAAFSTDEGKTWRLFEAGDIELFIGEPFWVRIPGYARYKGIVKQEKDQSTLVPIHLSNSDKQAIIIIEGSTSLSRVWKDLSEAIAVAVIGKPHIKRVSLFVYANGEFHEVKFADEIQTLAKRIRHVRLSRTETGAMLNHLIKMFSSEEQANMLLDYATDFYLYAPFHDSNIFFSEENSEIEREIKRFSRELNLKTFNEWVGSEVIRENVSCFYLTELDIMNSTTQEKKGIFDVIYERGLLDNLLGGIYFIRLDSNFVNDLKNSIH